MIKLKIRIVKKWVFLILLSLLLHINTVFAQEPTRGISYAVGVGFVGLEKMNGIGSNVSAFLPLSENSEIKADLSYNFLPPKMDGYKNLKISCLETDYRFVFEPGPVFIQTGIGLNVNLVNGGYSHKEIPGSIIKYEPYRNAFGLGMGLNIGVGFYVAPKYAVYGEFAAQGIFGKAETGWGGIKIGLRYFPMRVVETITRDWLKK